MFINFVGNYFLTNYYEIIYLGALGLFEHLLIELLQNIFKHSSFNLYMFQEISSIKCKYENELKLRNFSRKTIKSYLRIAEDFLNKSSNKISNEEVNSKLYSIR